MLAPLQASIFALLSGDFLPHKMTSKRYGCSETAISHTPRTRSHTQPKLSDSPLPLLVTSCGTIFMCIDSQANIVSLYSSSMTTMSCHCLRLFPPLLRVPVFSPRPPRHTSHFYFPRLCYRRSRLLQCQLTIHSRTLPTLYSLIRSLSPRPSASCHPPCDVSPSKRLTTISMPIYTGFCPTTTLRPLPPSVYLLRFTFKPVLSAQREDTP